MAGNPGVTLGFGNTEAQGQFYTVDAFPKLEDFIAGGLRMNAFAAMLQGSMKSIGRIYDIEDVAIVA